MPRPDALSHAPNDDDVSLDLISRPRLRRPNAPHGDVS
jgi:hypothetical protein